jgi:hypothetical protein
VESLSFGELSPLHQHAQPALNRLSGVQRVSPATVKWLDLMALKDKGEPLIIQPK